MVLLFCVILVDAIPFDPINVGGSISSPPMSVTGNSIWFSFNVLFGYYMKQLCNIGKDLMDALDTTVDPCQDFFQYACGGWIKKNPIPESKSRWTQFDALDNELTKTLKSNILLLLLNLLKFHMWSIKYNRNFGGEERTLRS